MRKVQDLRGVVGKVEVFAGGLAQFLAILTTVTAPFLRGPENFDRFFAVFSRAPSHEISSWAPQAFCSAGIERGLGCAGHLSRGGTLYLQSCRRQPQTSRQSPRCRLVAGPSKEHHHRQQHHSAQQLNLSRSNFYLSRPPLPFLRRRARVVCCINNAYGCVRRPGT